MKFNRIIRKKIEKLQITIFIFGLKEIGGSNSCYSLSNHQELDGRYNTTWEEVEKLVCHMNDDWEMLSISDIVLNHTANESLWIKDHPECTYNCLNTPNLRPAFLLDQMFFKVTTGKKS